MREVALSDERVEVAVASARGRITSSSEDQPAKERALASLESATALFRQFKTAQCEFEASTAAGGNSAGDIRALCRIALDKAYIGRLKDLHSFGVN